jgi:NADH-quinone oxidoreductase subunit I
MNPAEDTLNFSGSIFQDVYSAVSAKKPVLLMPFSLCPILKWQNMVYEKKHLLISGEGKYPGYNFYKNAGVDMGVKSKGEGGNEEMPVDIKELMP